MWNQYWGAVWDIGLWCSPTFPPFVSVRVPSQPQTRQLYCILFLMFDIPCMLYFVFQFTCIVCSILYFSPCIYCILYFSIRFAFSSQMYLPTETPSSHFYLLPSHLPSRGKKPLNTKDLSAARLALNILSQIFVCLPFHSRILHLSL